MPKLQTKGLFFEVETHGVSTNPALLLIRGLGSQIIDWPQSLIDGFVAGGYFVVAFDNRDAGLSEKVQDTAQAYSITDMARDCLDVLDALGIARAQFFGISMGGMIIQDLLCHAADRMHTATIVMSSIGDDSLHVCLEAALALAPARSGTDEKTLLAYALEDDAVYEGPAFPISRECRAAQVRRRYERCYCPDGQTRQFAAVHSFAIGPAELGHCTTPVLVINGDADPIFPTLQGHKIARALPRSNFEVIAGMGHELTDPLGAIIVDKVLQFTQSREGADARHG